MAFYGPDLVYGRAVGQLVTVMCSAPDTELVRVSCAITVLLSFCTHTTSSRCLCCKRLRCGCGCAAAAGRGRKSPDNIWEIC
jgi:hypothetical protein